MRTVLVAVGFLAVGCVQSTTPPPPPAETIKVNPQDVSRLKIRLGDDPAALLGGPRLAARPAEGALRRRLAHLHGVRQ